MPQGLEQDVEVPAAPTDGDGGARQAEPGSDDATTGEPAPDGASSRGAPGAAGEGLAGDVATVAVASLAVAALKAELLPGVLIGAGVLMLRRLMPDAALQPLLRTTVKAGYGVFSALQNALAEAAEQVEDVVAEARAEQRQAGEAGRGQAAAGDQAVH